MKYEINIKYNNSEKVVLWKVIDKTMFNQEKRFNTKILEYKGFLFANSRD